MSIRQQAGNSIARREDHKCRATFTEPSASNATLVLIAVGGDHEALLKPSDSRWELAAFVDEWELELYVWVWEGAPSITSAEVRVYNDWTSVQVRLIEYEGLAQENVIDKITYRDRHTDDPFSGSTGNISQANENVLGVLANRYASTTQGSFSGGLSKFYEGTSPKYYYDHGHWERDSDSNRTRLTLHQKETTEVDSFELTGRLSSHRDWCCLVITFKGGDTGPVRMTSTGGTALTVSKVQAELTTTGLFESKDNRQALTVSKVRARIGPFDEQYLVGGWGGLLLGKNSKFSIRSIEGLEGWDVRTSDAELPREAGAQRGVDLQSARRVLFEVNVPGWNRREIEDAVRELYAGLVPQRDEDIELIWRHPGQGVRQMWCRPIGLERTLDRTSIFHTVQQIELRASDPRHYSVLEHKVPLTVSPGSGDEDAITTSVRNAGISFAYPEIRIGGPSSGHVTRIELVNATTGSMFDVRAVLESGSELVGDMRAQVTAAPRSVVTIDGQSKYGAWQPIRDTFVLAPGVNAVYLRTEPEGADVEPYLVYRDTWPG